MLLAFILVCMFLILSDIADTETSVKIQRDMGYVESTSLYGKGTRPSRLKFYAISMPLNAAAIGLGYLFFHYVTPYAPVWAIIPMIWGVKHCIPAWSSYKTLKAANKW